MTDNNHPITLPPEFLRRLSKKAPRCRDQVVMTIDEWVAQEVAREEWIANQAAQWGFNQRGAVNEAELQRARDEELEACCADVQKLSGKHYDKYRADWLRSMRRPKPKSQAEEAIKALDSIASDLAHIGEEYSGDIIRAALERLRELEKQSDD